MANEIKIFDVVFTKEELSEMIDEFEKLVVEHFDFCDLLNRIRVFLRTTRVEHSLEIGIIRKAIVECTGFREGYMSVVKGIEFPTPEEVIEVLERDWADFAEIIQYQTKGKPMLKISIVGFYRNEFPDKFINHYDELIGLIYPDHIEIKEGEKKTKEVVRE